MNQEKIKQYKQELCVLLAIDSTLFCLVLIDFTHILQGGFTGIGAIIRLPQCQWSYPEEYG